MALRTDILIVLSILFEVGTGPCTIGSARLVEVRDVWGDFPVNQPARHWPGDIGCVCDQTLGMKIELGLHPLEHGLG
jgi:hypothetical protein